MNSMLFWQGDKSFFLLFYGLCFFLYKMEIIAIAICLFPIFSFVNVEVKVMLFHVTFNNNSVISWRSVLLMEETQVNPPQLTETLSHIKLYRVHLAWVGLELTMLLVICTDCIGSFESNYHRITTPLICFKIR